MLHRILTPIVGVLVIGAIGVGVSSAQDGYGHDHGRGGKPTGGKSKPAAPPGDMTVSRLSWSAYLTGESEVDDTGDDAGDPDAKGSAMFLQVDQRTVCYGFALRGADEPTAVHIHKGTARTNGAPVVEFANVTKDAAGAPAGDPGASSGCKTTDDPAEIAALRNIRRNVKAAARGREPLKYYVNFHTAEFPEGAARGQLSGVWFDNGE